MQLTQLTAMAGTTRSHNATLLTWVQLQPPHNLCELAGKGSSHHNPNPSNLQLLVLQLGPDYT